MTAEIGARRLRVCHIVATTEGAVWAFEQLRDLRDLHGFDVAVVLNGDSGKLVDRFRAAAIPVHVADFDFTSHPDLVNLPHKVLRIVRLLRRERFDVVQTHLFHSMVIGRIAGWIADVPVRLSMIAGPFHLEAYTPRWIDHVTSWMDTAIIPSCEHTRQLYRGLGIAERRLSLIYYGPDERKFDPAMPAAGLRREFGWHEETALVGMIAYFYTELPSNRWIPPILHGKALKGHEHLIRAAPIVLSEFPDTKFLLVGNGWEEGGRQQMERMRALAIELGLADSVIFTGFRTDVPRIYRDLDISVQPSLNENLGGTIESLLMERPTIVTRVGGLTDSVVDGETGVVVNPGDPEDLARAILRLLRDPAAARALGKAGRARMLARFTLRRTVDDLAALYRRLEAIRPKRFRSHITTARLILAGVFASAVAVRFLVFDVYLLPRWDLGWRPWHRRSLSLWPRIWLYRSYAWVGRHSSFGLRNKLHALRAWPRMQLYRAYAFVGRHSSFGLRNKLHALRSWPRMQLYRAYAFVGRHSSFGFRRKLRRAFSRLTDRKT
jgi:glycosyltransferase involved in cell wall biosynthesis